MSVIKLVAARASKALILKVTERIGDNVAEDRIEAVMRATVKDGIGSVMVIPNLRSVRELKSGIYQAFPRIVRRVKVTDDGKNTVFIAPEANNYYSAVPSRVTYLNTTFKEKGESSPASVIQTFWD